MDEIIYLLKLAFILGCSMGVACLFIMFTAGKL